MKIEQIANKIMLSFNVPVDNGNMTHVEVINAGEFSQCLENLELPYDGAEGKRQFEALKKRYGALAESYIELNGHDPEWSIKDFWS